jgi:hypothetical protein
MPPELTEDQRRAIFAAVVAAQDRGQSVPDSRRAVASQFGVTPEQVKDIEYEGIRERWPPLGD